MFSTNYLLFQPILAVAIGDALGVPYQFEDREFLSNSPITKMDGYKTFRVPKGTWSDDTSLTLASLDSLSFGFSLDDLMLRYSQWYHFGDYTPFHKSFDVGKTTKDAIYRFDHGTKAELCGGTLEINNGNGALMRITPLAIFLLNKYENNYVLNEEVAEYIHKFTSITHRTTKSMIASGILANVIIRLYNSPDKKTMKNAIGEALTFYRNQIEFAGVIEEFAHLGNSDFYKQNSEAINASGYVLDTLNVVFWCLFNSSNYRNATLLAVNFGMDADTIASITSMIATILFSPVTFPADWINDLKGISLIKKTVSNALLSKYF